MLVLFVGAGSYSWKKRKDENRAGCILNQRNVQQAIRSHQGVNNYTSRDKIDWKIMFGTDRYLLEPVCPAHGKYTFKSTYPEVGELAVECSLSGAPHKHVPPDHHDW